MSTPTATPLAASPPTTVGAAAPVRPPGPGWVPGTDRQGAIQRETLWYDDALGRHHPEPAPWVLAGYVGDGAQPAPVAVADDLAAPGTPVPAPCGDWAVAEATPFPDRGPARSREPAEAALRLLAHALAPVRRDLDGPFNDHRGYASPRCLFPVVGAVVDGGAWHVLDPDRRQVLPTGVPAGPHAEGTIALSGRWGRMPSGYGWFRGGLVAIETGIVLRHVAALAHLHGLDPDLRLPRTGWRRHGLPALWRDPDGWSPPVLLTPAGSPGPDPVSAAAPSPSAALDLAGAREHDADPYDDLVRVYGSHVCDVPAGPLGTGLPSTGHRAEPSAGGSWAEVLWHRSAGRMPRRLHGFRVAGHGLCVDDVTALADWADVPAPRPLAEVAGSLQVRAVVRDVDGVAAGAYDLVGGHLRPRAGTPDDAVTRFADAYLYGTDPMSRNDIGNAPLVLVVTARPREAVRRGGPGGWTALQQAAGWLAHGVSLGAAERRLVARPVRALDERGTARALALDDDEMVSMAIVVSHHAPHGGLQIDLRS